MKHAQETLKGKALTIRPHEFVGFFFEPDPILGWKMKPGRQGWFAKPGIRSWVRVNQLGFRGPEIQKQKPAETRRILMLGDSFGVAIEVDETQVFSRVLEDALNAKPSGRDRFEVVNASVGGYGTEQHLLFLEAEGAAFDPDIVLLAFHFGDDLIENSAELRRQIHWRLVKLPRPSVRVERAAGQVLTGTVPDEREVRRAWQRYWDLLPREHFAQVENDVGLAEGSDAGRALRRGLDLLTSRWRKLSQTGQLPVDLQVYCNSISPAVEAAWHHTVALIESLQIQAGRLGAELIIAGICTKEQVVPGYLGRRLEAWGRSEADFDPIAPNRWIEAAAAKLRIPYLDLTKDFRERSLGNSLYYENDLHWNSDGHRLAGELLGEFLDDQLNKPSRSGWGDPT